MSSLAPIYQIALYDTLGTRLALIDDYRSLQFGQEVNGAGFFTLQLSYEDSKRALFEADTILEVKRKIPGYVDWYTEFIGHCEDFSSTFFQNGNTSYSVVGSGFNGLLGRRIVAYDEGTSEANKSASSETAMKEYVRENIGTSATVANGREANGVMLNFSVAASGGAGDTWSGDRAGINLLRLLQEIANFSAIDFQVEVGFGGVGHYVFKTYVDQLGSDRTAVGLNTTTGLNSAGNTPHIFSLQRGNVQTARFSEKHKGEVNRVFVFAEDSVTGLGKIRYRQDVDAQAVSLLNVREAMRGGGSQGTNDEMDTLADEELEANQAEKNFHFVPLDTPSSLYGKDFFLGDKLTLRIGDNELNRRLSRVAITVSGGAGETNKEFDFSEIPQP